MVSLLIVANCPSSNTQTLFDAVVGGASLNAAETTIIIARQPLQATSEDVLNASGIIIGTTENFGYMSGQIKDFFERIYYPCLEHTQALPYALYVKGGLDGEGGRSSVERIITGLRWKAIQPPLVMRGDYQQNFATQTAELGQLMVAGLEAGIF